MKGDSEMSLKYEDLICLSRADLEAKKIDYGNRLVTVDAESILRLEEAGYCDAKGNLTEVGVKAVEKLDERIKVLRRGVPLEVRKRTDHHKVAETEGRWLTGEYRKKEYVCDGFFFMYAKAYASMNAERGSGAFRKHIPTMLSKVLAMKDLVELEAKYWQLQTFGGLEVIWLANEDRSLLVPIQSMYYDFTIKKYPSATFKGIDKEGTPIQIRVKQRGVPQDVVGVVMPLELEAAVSETMRKMVEKETANAA
jgi:hypothetical protein